MHCSRIISRLAPPRAGSGRPGLDARVQPAGRPEGLLPQGLRARHLPQGRGLQVRRHDPRQGGMQDLVPLACARSGVVSLQLKGSGSVRWQAFGRARTQTRSASPAHSCAQRRPASSTAPPPSTTSPSVPPRPHPPAEGLVLVLVLVLRQGSRERLAQQLALSAKRCWFRSDAERSLTQQPELRRLCRSCVWRSGAQQHSGWR
jgi:hypothetical protein